MASEDTRLDTWKEIAAYLGKDVRTAIRWEQERGLPVHRIPGQKRSGVFAWKSEVDRWRGMAHEPEAAAPATSPADSRSWSRIPVLGGAVPAIAVIVVSVTAFLSVPAPVPKLSKPARLAVSARPGSEISHLVASASGILFSERIGGGNALVLFNPANNSVSDILSPLNFPVPLSIQGSTALVEDGDYEARTFSLWNNLPCECIGPPASRVDVRSGGMVAGR
jgi:hypothetical protein